MERTTPISSNSIQPLSQQKECKYGRVLGRGAFGVVCSKRQRQSSVQQTTQRQRRQREAAVVKLQYRCATNDKYCVKRNRLELQFFRDVANRNTQHLMSLIRHYERDKVYVLELERMDGSFESAALDIDKKTAFFGDANPLAIDSFLLQLFTGISIMRQRGYMHNDLHAGNVAWKTTSLKTIEVQPGSSARDRIRIPTFGRIWKIIDYGLVGKVAPDDRALMFDEREDFVWFLFAPPSLMTLGSSSLSPSTSRRALLPPGARPFIDRARELYPAQVTFIERQVNREPFFSLSYASVFGVEAFARILFLVPPSARTLPPRAKTFLESPEFQNGYIIRPSLVASSEELLFLLSASKLIDSVIIPHLISRFT